MTPGHLTYEFPHPPRWNHFLAGLLINAIGIVVLIVSGARLNVIPIDPIRAVEHVTLVAPLTTQAKVESRVVPAIQPSRQTAKVAAPKPLPTVHVPPARAAAVEAKEIAPAKVVTSAAPVARPQPRAEIKTDVFASAPSPTATANVPVRKVQTGGFDDPNGVPPQSGPKRDTVMVASIGSFDLPAGAGHGNGAGGTHGISGTIRSAGFGEPATVTPKNDDRALAASGFDAAMPAKKSEPKPMARKALLQPVEIVYKPRPAYTLEARRLRVEGEVLLDVMFHADGSLHVNRVVKGLGYGLDDMALTAAQRIQFRPARRDGQPYDYAALVHIVFELSK